MQAFVVATDESWLTGLYRLVLKDQRNWVHFDDLLSDANITILYGAVLPKNAFNMALAQWSLKKGRNPLDQTFNNKAFEANASLSHEQ